MPFFPEEDQAPDFEAAAAGVDAATPQDRSFAANYLTSQQRSPFSSTGGVVGLAAASGLDLVDTVASSVIPGVDRQSVNNLFLTTVMRSPGLTKWFDDNKGAIEVGSGIAGILAAEYVGRKITAPASLTMQALRGIPGVRRIATLDKQYENAVRMARLTSIETARRGATGAERFIGSEFTFASLGKAPIVTSAGKANKAVFAAGLGRGVFQNVRTEALMGTFLHTNSMLYSDDIGHNVAWGVAGLGIGAGVDSLVGAYTLRKIATSEKIRRINAAAYDESGYEAGRLHSAGVADELAKITGGNMFDNSFMFVGQGARTDKITSLAIDAAELQKKRGFTERAMALFGKREAIATQKLTPAQEELNKVTVRGLRGVSRAGFGTRLEGLGAPLNESLVRDPTFLYGIEEIGTTVDNLTRVQTHELRGQNLANRFEHVQKLLTENGKWIRRRVKTKDGEVFSDELIPLSDEARDSLMQEAKELHYASSATAHTMLEPGEWMPIEMGEVADGFVPRRIIPEGGLGVDDVKVFQRERQKDPTTGFMDEPLGIRTDGEIYLPGNGKVDNAELPDMLHLYHAANAMVRNLAENGGKYIVPENANWFQLDVAEQVLKATADPATVQFPGKMTRETAQVEAFAQKVTALRKKESQMKLAKRGGFSAPLSEADIYKNKIHFNLPRLNSYQQGLLGTSETPLDLLINSFKSGDQVRSLDFGELLKGVNDAKKITGMTDEVADTLESLSGNSYNFLLDRDGVAIKPIIAYRRPLAPFQWSQDELITRQVVKQLHQRDSLMGADADPITKAIVTAVKSDPNHAEARKVTELADDQHRSFVPGFRNAAPQTGAGSFINSITSRERRDADNLTMLAASRNKELQVRVTQQIMRETVQNAMGDIITRVNSPRNVASKLLLDQFHSFRQGWELMRQPAVTNTPSGKGYQFVLDHNSAINKKRFAALFGGTELKKGQVMLNPNGTPMVLDELAMDAVTRMQTVHQAIINMKNTLLKSQGLPQIKQVPWYVPAANTKGKFMAFTFDERNEIVSDMTIIADSADDLAKQKAELQKNPRWKPGYTNRTRQETSAFMNLWDKAQMDFIAPNTTAIQPKKVNLGKTGTGLLNTSAFAEALVTMRDSMVQHGDDIMETLYDDVIESAMARAKIARVESEVGARDAEQHSSIYDRFLQNLTGKSSLSAKDSFFGGAYEWAEKRLNGMLASGPSMRVGEVYQGLKDQIATARPGDKGSEARFKHLTKELGPYMPFKSTMEMIERETGSQTPKEIAEIASKLSWFEATSRLRWFESMHAVANIGGILSNMPAVMRALQPLAGETVEEAARRNSSLTMMLATPNGTKFNIPNMPKLMWASMKDAWDVTRGRGLGEFNEKSIARGFMDQEVAEFHRTWGAINSKDGWRGFVFGDEGRTAADLRGPFKGARAAVARSGGLDKWLGILSDKSEAFSRQWGMHAGRRVAESMGITGIDDQIAFAHDITNKMIANYDPRNRPEVFQGAIGASIGLFQSYMMNYYSRMFRYIETGNHRALATQYAAQSGVFGMQSVPGWNALNWAFFDNQQGENDDPVDSMYRRFDPATADLLMHGTLSNLPKLVGADGLSLYTRGDSQVRVPAVPVPQFLGGSGTAQLPIIDTASRIWKGVGEAVGAVANGGLSATRMAEIASNVLTNRPLAGMIETMNGTPDENGNFTSYDTDWGGQVVAKSQGVAENVYRALGVRAEQQQNEIEQFYANRNAQTEQAARKATLNASSRSAIRAGNFDDLPALFAEYVDEGGDARYYSKWIKNNFSAGLDTRGERMLDKALKDPDNSKNAYIARLLDAQVGVQEGEEDTEDYGRDDQIDQIVAQGWEDNPEPLGNPLDVESVDSSPQQ